MTNSIKILLVVCLVLPTFSWAGRLYVKPRLLKMYENASRTSSIISVIPQGEEVTYLKKIKGMYVLVKYDQVQGWVVKHSISKKKPSDIKRVNIFRSKDNLSAKSQQNASKMSSGGVINSATNLQAMVFGEFEVKLVVPRDETQYQKQYAILEKIMNSQTGMSDAKDFIK